MLNRFNKKKKKIVSLLNLFSSTISSIFLIFHSFAAVFCCCEWGNLFIQSVHLELQNENPNQFGHVRDWRVTLNTEYFIVGNYEIWYVRIFYNMRQVQQQKHMI